MTTRFKNGLAKHPSGYYHYCIRLNGQQYKGSTRATDLATARTVLEQRRRQIVQEGCGIRQIPTLAQLRDEWLRIHKAVHSKKHWRDVETVSRLWIIPSIGTRRIDRITPGDALLLRSHMLEAGRSPVTVNDMLKILKLIGNFAVKQGYIKQLPFRVQFLRVQKKPRPILASTNAQAFLALVDQSAVVSRSFCKSVSVDQSL
jgi:integrase